MRNVFLLIILSVTATFARAQDARDLKESGEDVLGICKLHAGDFAKAKDAGCRVVNLEKHGTFFAYWLPLGFDNRKEKRILVMMHGSNGNAYRHLLNMTDVGEEENFGIVSIQWGWPQGRFGQYRYLDAPASYSVISQALDYLVLHHKIDKHLCAWNGFSRSATQCAIFAFLDRESKKDYFNFFIAVSGGIGPDQPIMRDLLDGKHGEKPIAGDHFYLWTGKRDFAQTRPMRESVTLLEKLGGTVTFRETTGLHGGFYRKPELKREAVRLWKQQRTTKKP